MAFPWHSKKWNEIPERTFLERNSLKDWLFGYSELTDSPFTGDASQAKFSQATVAELFGAGADDKPPDTKPNFSSNVKLWEVGGGAQDLEQDQISEKMRSSGKWAAGPRN